MMMYNPRDSHAVHMFYTDFYTQTQKALDNRCETIGEKIMVKNYLDMFYLVTDSKPKTPERGSDALIDKIEKELEQIKKK